MEQVIYNARYEEYKCPFGAVSNNTEVVFNIKISSEIIHDKVFFIYRADNSNSSNYIYMDKTESYDGYFTYSCKVSFNLPGLYFYRFEIKNNDEIKFIGKKNNKAIIGDWLPEWQLTVYDKDFNTPDWAKGALMYQIFPDRFKRSDNFTYLKAKNERKIHQSWDEIPEFIYDTPNYKANDYFMGNIDGIIEMLDYIKELGVSIIYLNPIFESPEYHRYSTGNYFNVDPYFGTNEIFKKLCEEAKKRDIKIILDGVFSHTGADSIYFNKYGHYDSLGASNSKESPYYNWYSFINYPDKYECWWGFENLPNVNENHPDYTEYITGKDGVIDFWQKLGASGWRLDVADELPDDFLEALYKRAKQTDKDAFIIGEVWEDATNKFAYDKRRKYLLGGQMDSVMNYPFRTAILDFVKNGNSQLFEDRIFDILENYPPQVSACLMNSISTHDTERALTFFGVENKVMAQDYGKYILSEEEYNKGKEGLLLATFLQFTLPGLPSVFYGDEVGLYGFKDPYCRRTYPYGKEDFEILDFYKRLGKIRNEYKKDFSSCFTITKNKEGFFVFQRGGLLCIINLSDKAESIEASGRIIFEYGKASFDNNNLISEPKSVIIIKKQES